MPFSGIFPFSEYLKSPLAKDLTFAGSSYKCVMLKDSADELNAENYRLFIHVTTATAALIAENAKVTIEGVDYYVTYKEETAYGSVRLFLTQADADPNDTPLGSELFDSTNFTGENWEVLYNATLATGLATLNEYEDDPAQIQYGTTIPLDAGASYRLRVVVSQLLSGVLIISDSGALNYTFYVRGEGTHDLFFQANKTDTRYITFSALNNTEVIKITSVSLKKVL